MFEGERTPDDVLTESIPSLRRNPVLADLFQRMHFMERRGSGLRKICQATMNEDNYEKRFMPRFEERTGFFFVTLWNMNIGVAPQTPSKSVMRNAWKTACPTTQPSKSPNKCQAS